ncbi:hypothetical protein GOBAR_DD13204 [Gossypium barbadense]|nr:hypothetical protein GOBAR_DD13204 [Gossypium barbadense]
METPESGRAVALEFPASETPSSSRVPRRIRKRLLAECKSPSTVEEIEAKLRHADLRRQQFYESLSSKARSKPRSPSRSSNEEDLGQRLEAKLQAAEQKRLSILAKAQMRLAKLDELRQAAKTGVEMRFEKEREKLGTKVQSRVQQAEANRMLILEAYSQRRATLRERSSQSLLRRMARESKYKELVRAAIHQKRAAAEKKRLGLLEAEKKKACARISQVKRVAKSISHQREIERRTMKDQLEDRLQRAKRQRAEYLRQRGRSHKSVQENYTRMYKQAELLSRKLARCWRWFIRQRKTTLNLAKAFDSLKINENSVKRMPFEQLALLIESVTTLQTVKALLDRIESLIKAARAVGATDHLSSLDNIDHLLKRVATPKRRTTPRTSMRSRETKRVVSGKEAAKSLTTVSRYPVRVFLCAYMILGHPEAVLSGQGEREIALAKSAEAFVREFELLVKIILEGPIQSPDEESDSTLSKPLTFRSQLAAFDKAWCSYLSSFMVWKVKDARSLEEDLVRAACQLELSMIQKCKLTPEGDKTALTHDMKAIQRQVMEDQKLLREKVQHLCGDAGIERMECALSETRTKFFQSEEGGSQTGSPIMPSLSSSTDGSPSSLTARTDNGTDLAQMPNRVVRSLFKDDEDSTSSSKNSVSSVTSSSHLNTQLASSIEKQPVSENELIVNEFLHEKRGFVDSISGIEEDQNGIKAKIRETMEKAFWDGIMESMSQDKPNYDRVLELVKELVSGVSGLTLDFLPETFTLNLARLRGVQAEIQKIIVISTSILICRQIFSSEQVVASPTDMESIILICTERLLELLDHVEDVGIEGIVEVISGFSRVTDEDKVQMSKVMMGRMLAKSLQAGDVVFEKVWRAVYLAFRGVVFGGSGVYGRKLAEIALRQVGAGTGSGLPTERVVKAAEVLVVAATVSVNVHGPWYITLIGNM